MTITSRSGKKEATIVYTILGGFRVTLEQIVTNGINIEKYLLLTKNGFSTYGEAAKWALKHIH